jgi:hypothetical protein
MKKVRPEIVSALHELRFTRFLNSRMLPKPPKGFCKWCGRKFIGRVWCGGECRQEAYVRMGYVDNYIFIRDGGICAKCGIDTVWLRNNIIEIVRLWRRYGPRDISYYISYSEFWDAYGPWGRDFHKRLWEADHIIPVCEGGGCCGLENYQTLCLRCHKKESANLAKRRQVRPGQKSDLPSLLEKR